uniref:Uncharacterized protein n=1 Tax=Cacopsylla melanoneura TaxID=428564 RepID=A0A8D8Q909_9HEMI
MSQDHSHPVREICGHGGRRHIHQLEGASCLQCRQQLLQLPLEDSCTLHIFIQENFTFFERLLQVHRSPNEDHLLEREALLEGEQYLLNLFQSSPWKGEL